jgi:Transposase domain (DUF772)
MRGTGVELACPTFFLEWLLFPFVRSTIVEKGIIDLPYGKGRHAPIAAEDQARVIATCFGIRSERKLCEEVKLHLAYRWFCRLDLNDAIPHHSTSSENRLNRFRESDLSLCHDAVMFLPR